MGRPRILVVDDDAAQLGQVTGWLEDAGFAVGAALGGATALEWIDQGEWDLVLTDLVMPRVDGWQVLRHLRAHRPAIPVVSLSSTTPGWGENGSADPAFDATLDKASTGEEVQATLWRLLLHHGSGGAPPDWNELARLAGAGEVSGIEDWIATERSRLPDADHRPDWIESLLHRLDLAGLERLARLGSEARPDSRSGDEA